MFALKLIAAPILVLAAAQAVPAAAAEPQAARTVAYSDLNLETDAGRAELERRLTRAVASICSVDGLPSSAALDAEQSRCVAETSASFDTLMADAIRANRARAANFASAGN